MRACICKLFFAAVIYNISDSCLLAAEPTVDGVPVSAFVFNPLNPATLPVTNVELEAAKELMKVLRKCCKVSEDKASLTYGIVDEKGATIWYLVNLKPKEAEIDCNPNLNEADKLNGYEWKGSVEFFPWIFREVDPVSKQASEYKQLREAEGVLGRSRCSVRLNVAKKNGVWSVESQGIEKVVLKPKW